MTSAQRSRLYFTAWSAAAQAHQWQSQTALVTAPRLEVWASPELNKIYQRIWDLAEQFAIAQARSTKPDYYRHACHVVALGRDKSSVDMTNDQTDRVVALFRLLADPEDLSALMAWRSPNEARRKRILHWIQANCVESYVVAVCRDKFGHDQLMSLSFQELQQLHVTLRGRTRSRKSSAAVQ